MAQKSFIEIYKVEEPVCDKIIAFYEKHRHFAQPGRLGENLRIDKSMKDSMDISIPPKMFNQLEPFFEILTRNVDAYVQKYFYDTGARGMGPIGLAEHANIQWYPKGGGYPAMHCERDHLYYGHRALVWMMYLTDTPDGGTEFPHQDMITECVKGDLVIWPPDMTHMHRGVVSQSHEKMIITGWINFLRGDTQAVNQPGKPSNS